MGGQPKREEMSYELRVFLSEVGEVVREYLEKKHRRRGTVREDIREEQGV